MRGTGTSTMTLSARNIQVKFDLVNKKGEVHRGTIPFTRG